MRKQIREIRLIDLIVYFLVPQFLICGTWLIYAFFLSNKDKTVATISLAVAILLTYVFAKYFLIGAVLMYKAFAPMSMRRECRFEPTCSTYMIMALRKYGLLIGLAKGVYRIARCHPPNGGIDYP